MRLPTKTAYWTLRWSALLLGAAVCAWVLFQADIRAIRPDILLLSVLACLLRLRAVVFRRTADGAQVNHLPGEAVFVIALLRLGPAGALATCLLTELLSLPAQSRIFLGRPAAAQRRALVTVISDIVFVAALYWAGGCLYERLGGMRILTATASGRFFQDPRAALLPLAATMLVVHGIGDCLYPFTLSFFTKHRAAARTFLDPTRSVFLGLEVLGGALALVLWTAWGWGTLPFALLINETLILAGRNHFERLNATRDAECDPLTGLASWRGIDRYLHQRLDLARARRSSLALLFIDADGLKAINDHFGHSAGDELLRLIGECCRLCTRERDLVGRRGGDEFLVILDDVERMGAEKMQARLQQAVADALVVHPVFSQVKAGISVGVAMFPTDAGDVQTLIEIADRRMYQDKQARKLLLAMA